MKKAFPIGVSAIALGLIILAASGPASAAPATTSEAARAFLGGRTGKVAYLKGPESFIYFVDFSDSVLTERRVSAETYCLSPMISPDGTRIVYERNSAIWIRNLVQNSPAPTLIHSRPPVNSQTMEPRWWIDPATQEEYILYNTGIIEDHEWPPKSGNTYLIKISDGQPTGGPRMLTPFMMSGGRSKNGMWGATSHHSTGMYRLYPEKIENAFFDAYNWTDFGVLLACNASISPSADPARQDRVMHLTSGGTSMHGTPYDNHKAVLIRSWKDPDADHPFWWMGPPGDRVEDDSSGNLFWDAPEWSTDEDYFTVTGSKDIEVLDTADLYITRLNLTGDSRLLKVVSGPGRNRYSHLWIKDGVRPAKMSLDSASLSFASFRKDTADPAPKTVSISNIGDGTLPALTLGPLPDWLEIAIEGNGTNAVKLVHSVRREEVDTGRHEARVTVSFGQGADTAGYPVTFIFSDPVLTTLKPMPARAVLTRGDSVRLGALALDQAGRPMPDTPAVSWSGAGALRPSPDGWFRADSIAGRTYSAIGTSGGVACTTEIVVVNRHLRIDAGAAEGQAGPGWEADGGYVSGGNTGSVSDAPDLSHLVDPAPAGAFRSWRKGFSGYAFPDLPNARYRVRFHFMDPEGTYSGGISIKLEGQSLIADYKLPAPAAGSEVRTGIREVNVTVSDGNGLSMEAAAAQDAPALAAIEIYDLGPPPVSLLSPNGGQTFAVGDTLPIRWLADSSITSCGIQISVDSGAKWLPITRRRSVGAADPDWQDHRWVIPDTMDGVSLVTSRALISVYDYFGTDRDRSDGVFTIESGSDVSISPRGDPAEGLVFARMQGRTLSFELRGQGPWTVSLVDMRGRQAAVLKMRAAGRSSAAMPDLAPGLYRLMVTGGGKVHSRLLPWMP